ncbi:hypothetical protein ACEE21_15060 [Clostridium baratii]
MYYSDVLASLNRDLKDKIKLEKRVAERKKELQKAQQDYVNLMNAQKLLSTVSDDNTEATLLFVSGVINKALAEIFKGDTRRIYLSRKLYGGTKPHIVVELENGKGEKLDMSIQSGTGLRQIISVLFVICLIEVRKGRRLLILDERLSGLHSEAKRILSEIISIFAEGGFQFVFVEYSLNKLGKLYNVEKPGNEAKVYALDGVEYSNDDVFLFSDVDLSLLDDNYTDDLDY